MGTYTTNYNLFLPSIGEQGWGDLVNGNFTTIDTTMKSFSNHLGTLETETDAIDSRLDAIGNYIDEEGNLRPTKFFMPLSDNGAMLIDTVNLVAQLNGPGTAISGTFKLNKGGAFQFSGTYPVTISVGIAVSGSATRNWDVYFYVNNAIHAQQTHITTASYTLGTFRINPDDEIYVKAQSYSGYGSATASGKIYI